MEATTAQSPNGGREVIAGAGVKRAEVAGSGVFKDAMSDALMRAAYFVGGASNFELVIPGFGTLRGPFAITDGAYGEPFVFRQKDVRGWWTHAHHPLSRV